MRIRRHCLIVLLIAAGSLPFGRRVPQPRELTEAQRATEFAKLAPVPEHYLLDSELFPVFEFAEPNKVRELIGPYRLKRRLYGFDKQFPKPFPAPRAVEGKAAGRGKRRRRPRFRTITTACCVARLDLLQ